MITLAMNVISLSRFQFAMTTLFHFLYVPLSIGFGLMVAIMETIYVKTKNPVYLKMTKFWSKIFLLSFAVGVVTGIIQEFQFGMNWSNYSRFMGDIFGAPLAIEALLAFFLESTMLGVWMFTWDRFKPAVHAIFMWLTWLGSALSALWILAANSFMQHPTGFMINTKTSHVKLTDFWSVISNEQLWYQFPHVIFGAFTTAAMVVAGMSAFGLIWKQNHEFHLKSLRLGLIVGLIFAVATIAAGDLQTRYIIKDQPMKFAATEGIYKNTTSPASWQAVALIDTKNEKVDQSIEVPYLLSLLSYHKLSGSVTGMTKVNKELHAKYDKKFGKNMNYYVPVKTLFWSFRIMAGGGSLIALVCVLGLFFSRKKKNTLLEKKWLLWVLALTTFLPFIVNSCGWLITELGRYPWVVYGLQTIADAVSPTSTVGGLLFTNIVYFLLFAALGAFMFYYARKTLKDGPDHLEKTEIYDDDSAVDPLDQEVFNK
ncbi:cytochrome ubiquinol oxidase subunit I [Oenococcus sicerae]|uniref:Cytochrome ubiquinol oxidase subunit I n=1 Tax=Oenococcus sicerae TaxID=2203724 RepID=A0AAJ1RA36_9LACO|nr:cytochrome ubiquinol oxidase subunit I [Oenococcus sicerae]MDN6899788.1 cytochrome ubiquinol oxidase subunit I [Oenococcus sicerae]